MPIRITSALAETLEDIIYSEPPFLTRSEGLQIGYCSRYAWNQAPCMLLLLLTGLSQLSDPLVCILYVNWFLEYVA